MSPRQQIPPQPPPPQTSASKAINPTTDPNTPNNCTTNTSKPQKDVLEPASPTKDTSTSSLSSPIITLPTPPPSSSSPSTPTTTPDQTTTLQSKMPSTTTPIPTPPSSPAQDTGASTPSTSATAGVQAEQQGTSADKTPGDIASVAAGEKQKASKAKTKAKKGVKASEVKKSSMKEKRKGGKKAAAVVVDDDDDSDDEDESGDEEDSSSESESEGEKKRRRKGKAAAAAAAAAKKRKEKERKAKEAKRNVKVKKGGKSKKSAKKAEESSSEESESDSESEESEDSDSSESEVPVKKSKKVKGKAKTKVSRKTKTKKSKGKKVVEVSSEESDSDSSDSSASSSSSSSSSDSDSDSSVASKRHSKTKSKKSKKSKKHASAASSTQSSTSEETYIETAATTPLEPPPPAPGPTADQIQEQIIVRQNEIAQLLNMAASKAVPPPLPPALLPPVPPPKVSEKKEAKKVKQKPEFKRVDQIWDSKLRDYKYTESAEEKKDDIDSVFTVRRKFNWENKYQYTLVDIKSHFLRDALQVILKDVKGQSLVEDAPSIDPHLLFLYYDEIKTYYRKTLKRQLKKERKRKQQKRITEQIAHCKLLASYIDHDFAKTRKTLTPMLKAGNITFELIWALFKPNTVAYTPTYGNKDDPRCFKVDYCFKETDFMDQEWWTIEGRYLEYDGKKFGLGDHAVRIDHFKGTRKIASLSALPLVHHKNAETLRTELIERGKKFVALQGMNYRFHKGLAYLKKKRTVAKININGRVMVDPAIFRRINPNYPLSYLKHKEDEGEDSEDEEEECGCDESDDEDSDDEQRMKIVVYRDRKGHLHVLSVPDDEDENDIQRQKLEALENAEDGSLHTFTQEELLIASPVVLGFAFSEKLWLEFSLSGIAEIEWNSDAFDSLVLRSDIKQNLKGLVSSHRFNAAKTIDDVIQGKGKGLNVVLHGPPGVGKTLTGESIADFLQCPLYAVSAGELGTNSRALESDLQRIMDITHSWGAILLLDEADVFLEQRQPQDIHRNSLVSVFLRLTEYYQGIMFMTTNRVATFDEAFQSRIHMGIKYENLTGKARREIWMHHVHKIEKLDDQESLPFKDVDFDELSKKVLNGRQIKNTVITAQSIALAEETPFSLSHVKRVLNVAEDFENDMRGGSGYRDAMRQYT